MVRKWRWLVVGGIVAALVALPSIVHNWPVPATGVGPADLADRIAASAGQSFEGTVATRGGLDLPDLPGAEDRTELFGSASRLRAWYLGPDAWRVDVLDATGENDTYRDARGLSIWESGRRLVRRIDDEPELRLPRAADLVPPELARRLLGAARPDELVALAPVRVAGRAVPGLSIVPAHAASSVEVINIWAEPVTGLALRVVVVPRQDDVPVLESKFLEVSLRPPDPDVVRLSPPPGTEVRREGADDPIAEIGRRSSSPLPDDLAGLERTSERSVGAATYGTGFTQVLLVGLPAPFVGQVVPASLPATPRPWGGEATLVETPLVNAMSVIVGPTAYVVAGSVSVAELDRLAAALAGR